MSGPGTDSAFDPKAFRRELDALLRRYRDPLLHDAVWAHLDGTITRAQLRQTPAYQRVVGDYYRDRLAELGTAGLDLRAVRAEVRARVEADDVRDGTAYAEQVLTPAEATPPVRRSRAGSDRSEGR